MLSEVVGTLSLVALKAELDGAVNYQVHREDDLKGPFPLKLFYGIREQITLWPDRMET